MNFSYTGKMLSDDVTQVVSSVRSFEHLGTVAYFENHKGVGAALLYHDPCRNQHCKITVFA